MSKKVKSIKCPQCGSVENTLIKEDYYRCNNCGTQYYLDNDDININVTHRVEGSRNTSNTKKIVLTVFFSFLFVFFLLFLVIGILIPSKSPSTKSYIGGDGYRGVVLDSPVDINGKPYILTLSNKLSTDKQESFYSFTDPTDLKIVKTEKLPNVGKLSSMSQDLYIRRFTTGDIYLIVDQKVLFKLDKSSMTFDDVTTDMFSGDSLYTSGIANIHPYVTYHGGDCFKVMTNMGKEYYYCPRIKQSYTKSNMSYNAMDKESLRSDSKEAVKFVFTEKQWDSMEMDNVDATQLLKVIYQDNGGGPSDTYFTPKWQDQLGKLELSWGYRSGRIVSYKNLTPGRLYFNPEIFYSDKDHLLLKVTATASKESAASLQRINTETGELMWTVPLELSNSRYVYYLDRSVHSGNKFLLKLKDGTDDYYIIDDDGNNGKHFSLK